MGAYPVILHSGWVGVDHILHSTWAPSPLSPAYARGAPQPHTEVPRDSRDTKVLEYIGNWKDVTCRVVTSCGEVVGCVFLVVFYSCIYTSRYSDSFTLGCASNPRVFRDNVIAVLHMGKEWTLSTLFGGTVLLYSVTMEKCISFIYCFIDCSVVSIAFLCRGL